jgi:hypothetical protein
MEPRQHVVPALEQPELRRLHEILRVVWGETPASHVPEYLGQERHVVGSRSLGCAFHERLACSE